MSEQKITVAQRMQNFATLTRQHMHMIPKQVATAENTTLQFIYPKTRLLAQTFLKVDVVVASGQAKENESPFDKYGILRKITMDLNNGFSPVVMSGKELAMFNSIATHSQKVTGDDGMIEGNATKYSFVLEIKNTLNDSMLQGLILLQNNATMVTLNVDIGKVTDALASGTLTSVTVQPMIVTYSVPGVPQAFPDISVLKLMQARTTTFNSGGENVVYLDTGTIYRKLAFYVTDENGAPLKAEDINGEIQLAFNTADIPYSITAPMLRMLNADQFGRRLPDGYFVFDFSSQSPLIGYGGSRDYIDTEKLTQFTLKVNTANACKITTITEQLSRLQ